MFVFLTFIQGNEEYVFCPQ